VANGMNFIGTCLHEADDYQILSEQVSVGLFVQFGLYILYSQYQSVLHRSFQVGV
jgi:hypothetical protein